MPIRGLLDVQEVAFDPEDITAITAAHEVTLKRLKLTDRTCPLSADIVAKFFLPC
jgi:hypothetical protein